MAIAWKVTATLPPRAEGAALRSCGCGRLRDSGAIDQLHKSLDDAPGRRADCARADGDECPGRNLKHDVRSEPLHVLGRTHVIDRGEAQGTISKWSACV